MIVSSDNKNSMLYFLLRWSILLSALCLVRPGHADSMTVRSPVPGPARSADSIPLDLQGLYQQHPRLVEGLFGRLNLDYPGLEDVRGLVSEKKWVPALKALVTYYQTKSADHYSWLKTAGPAPKAVMESANNVLKDIFTFQEVTAQQQTRPGGRLNWYYTGPRQDKEWAYFLNRQGYFNDLLEAYKSSGNRVYARKLNALAGDWVLTNPLPAEKVSTVTWRELEVGLRLTSGNWPRVFYGFAATGAFSPVVCILMLSSVPEQAGYIMRYHRMHSNWAAMELNGLASAAFYWPEFRDAPAWLRHATEKMQQEQAFEVYPDGVQNELTSDYHTVAMNNFAQFAELAEKNGETLPAVFGRTLEKMVGYLAQTMRPNGYGLLNNDANLSYTRSRIAKAAEQYGRKDWAYIASGGTRGEAPATGSVFFPWAGQMLMRSGWKPTDQWAFFDVGPWGNAHQHNDKLHLSVAAFGHDWLVDAGRYYYKWDAWRRYFISSAAHNVVLVDGAGQRPYQKLAAAPLKSGFSCQPTLDFCMGSYTNGFSQDPWQAHPDSGVIHAVHTRAVVYLKGICWVVFDHVSSPKGATLEPLWHFAPVCKVKIEDGSITASDSSDATLQVIPSDPSRWHTSLIRGQQQPVIQGWYSRTYNEKEANDCVRYQTIARDTATTFAWVIYPSAQGAPQVKLTVLEAPPGASRLRVTVPGQRPAEVAVRFYGDKPVPLSGGLFLEGDCSLQQDGLSPVVAGGVIRDKSHRTLAEDKGRQP